MPQSVTDEPVTTYEAGGTALTDRLTAFSRKRPDLAAVVEAWPGLTEAVKAGIVAMVKAASGEAPIVAKRTKTPEEASTCGGCRLR